MKSIKSVVKSVRLFRSLHRWIGVCIAIFLLIVSLTGLMLGWKKHVDILQPLTQQGASSNISSWKSFEEIAIAAQQALSSLKNVSTEVDRLDVRPDKGIIKVLFKKSYWEVQVDGRTGKVLSIGQRHSDWIEHIHDGSIITDGFKLVYTNIIAIGLFALAVSGIWLWYGPKVIRKSK